MTPFEFDMALQRPVFYMMRRGILVDTEKKEQIRRESESKWERYQTLLNEVVGHPDVNVNSPKLIKSILYDYLELPTRKKNKRLTTNEDAIRSLMAFAEHKIRTLSQEEAITRWERRYLTLRLILLTRGIRKGISSYLKPPVDGDSRARCMMTVGGAENFRFSHSKTSWGTGLNLATVPHDLRVMYVADEGMELSEFDLNRGESWVYAHLSDDPEMIRIHQDGEDFHSESASTIQTAFGSEGLTTAKIAALNKKGDPFAYRIRYLGKKVNHASAYRMGPFRAAEVINEESDETGITVVPGQMQKAQKLWLQKYPGIQSWWDEIDHILSERRELRTIFGRRRQFFGHMGDHLKKEATSWEPSCTSVDYLNRGMLRVYEELVKPGRFGLELLNQVHDSILVQYPIENREQVHREIPDLIEEEITVNGHTFTIPVEGAYGQNWGDYHEERNPEGLKTWEA